MKKNISNSPFKKRPYSSLAQKKIEKVLGKQMTDKGISV
jgi:hypothetical protein